MARKGRGYAPNLGSLGVGRRFSYSALPNPLVLLVWAGRSDRRLIGTGLAAAEDQLVHGQQLPRCNQA